MKIKRFNEEVDSKKEKEKEITAEEILSDAAKKMGVSKTEAMKILNKFSKKLNTFKTNKKNQ